MKKVFMLCMSLCMTLTLAACSGGSESTDDKVKIGIVTLMEHNSLNTIYDSIVEQLEKEGYVDGENTTLYFQNANNDYSVLPTIFEQMKNDDVDVVIAITTPVATAAASIATDIPIVFSAVSDPIGAKLVEALDKTTYNITGTSDEVQVDLILDLAIELFPTTKTIGYLYNSGEANSVSNLVKVQDYVDKNGYTLNAKSVTNASEIQTAMNALVKDCDFIFSATDNTVASAMSQVSAIANEANVPFFAGADSMVEDGAFATFGIRYEDLGIESANIAISIIEGTLVEDIPVKIFNEDLKVFVNQATADAIGFTNMKQITSNYDTSIIEE